MTESPDWWATSLPSTEFDNQVPSMTDRDFSDVVVAHAKQIQAECEYAFQQVVRDQENTVRKECRSKLPDGAVVPDGLRALPEHVDSKAKDAAVQATKDAGIDSAPKSLQWWLAFRRMDRRMYDRTMYRTVDDILSFQRDVWANGNKPIGVSMPKCLVDINKHNKRVREETVDDAPVAKKQKETKYVRIETIRKQIQDKITELGRDCLLVTTDQLRTMFGWSPENVQAHTIGEAMRECGFEKPKVPAHPKRVKYVDIAAAKDQELEARFNALMSSVPATNTMAAAAVAVDEAVFA